MSAWATPNVVTAKWMWRKPLCLKSAGQRDAARIKHSCIHLPSLPLVFLVRYPSVPRRKPLTQEQQVSEDAQWALFSLCPFLAFRVGLLFPLSVKGTLRSPFHATYSVKTPIHHCYQSLYLVGG